MIARRAKQAALLAFILFMTATHAATVYGGRPTWPWSHLAAGGPNG